MCAVLRFIQLIMTNIMKPITAIQIFYEPQVGTEQEVLRTFFSFVGCLVKTTRMSAEDMSKQHKILAHPENKQTAYLFLTDCYPGDSEPAATLCDGQPQFALDARPYLRDAIEHASKETMPFTAEIFLQYGLSEKQMYADCERALQCFQKALQLDDSSYKAMFQIACLDVADRKYQHAKAGFKKVIVSIQGNDANPDWSGMSLEEILYVYRSYVWLAKLVLVSDGEFAIGAPIAMALNAAVAFRQATILDACCDPENHQRVGRYHGSGIVLRAMFVLLRDMVGDAETNRELGEEIENNIKCYGIK